MIILGLLIDYFITNVTPLRTYFVIWELDKNKVFNVLIAGIFLDFIYHRFLYNAVILLSLYLIIKRLNIKNKYYWPKNLVVFFIYFNLLFFLGHTPVASYIYVFIEGITGFVIYSLIMKKLFIK